MMILVLAVLVERVHLYFGWDDVQLSFLVWEVELLRLKPEPNRILPYLYSVCMDEIIYILNVNIPKISSRHCRL